MWPTPAAFEQWCGRRFYSKLRGNTTPYIHLYNSIDGCYPQSCQPNGWAGMTKRVQVLHTKEARHGPVRIFSNTFFSIKVAQKCKQKKRCEISAKLTLEPCALALFPLFLFFCSKAPIFIPLHYFTMSAVTLLQVHLFSIATIDCLWPRVWVMSARGGGGGGAYCTVDYEKKQRTSKKRLPCWPSSRATPADTFTCIEWCRLAFRIDGITTQHIFELLCQAYGANLHEYLKREQKIKRRPATLELNRIITEWWTKITCKMCSLELRGSSAFNTADRTWNCSKNSLRRYDDSVWFTKNRPLPWRKTA